ncbi:MAG: LPS assembly lipoprotein LptE [Gammaproteobacteria bacterium]|nr:LPS assembly lipoprotein LptE [Gammaproteobacteria bacterium]
MKIAALHVVLLAAALVHGCGYHLRGQSPQVKAEGGYSIHVSAAAGPLADAVRSQLAITGVRVTDGIKGAGYVLTMSGGTFERQVVSVSPETGKVEEYLIVFTARISISEAGATDLVTAFDEDAALGKFSEEETIREELIEQAAAQIIRRLDTLAN